MKKVLSVLITAALVLQLLVMFGAVSAEGATAMTVTSPSGTVGSTVTVEVGIANNPGFHALQCEIEYDETMLELVSIEGKIGKTIPSMDNWDMVDPGFISEAADSRFIYIDPRVESDAHATNMVTGNEVATLTFKLLATGTSNVTVNCVELAVYDNAATAGYRLIPTTAGIGTITVAERPANNIGDVNMDGTVDFADLQRLYQHLSTDNKLSAVALSLADTNKDTTVDFADLQRLYQHLSTDNKLF